MVYMIRYLNYARQADPLSRRTAIMAMAPALAVSLIATITIYLWNRLQGPFGGWLMLIQAAGVLFVTWGILIAVQYKSLREGVAILGK